MSSKNMNTTFRYGSGVQADLIPKMKSDDILITHIHQKQGRGRAIVKPDTLKLLSESNNGIYESIVSYPCKVFFDIDGKKPSECNLSIVKPIINKYFNNPKMAISGYESEEKNSYHIVLPDLLIKDYNDLLNMKKLIQKIQKENKYFDDAVYTRNREMKAINQSKPKSTNIQKIIENDNVEDHFITCYINKDSKPFEFMTDYDDNKINVSSLPIATPEIKQDIEKKVIAFTPADHDNALKLLNLIPCNDDNLECQKFANFAFYNNISFEEFWEWCKKKNDSFDRRKKYEKRWNYFKQNAEFKFTLQWIKNRISLYYPNFHIIDDYKTKTFVNSFDLPNVKIPVRHLPTFETADIQLKHYETSHKVAIFNIGMGGGKTGSTVSYLKDTKKSFIWLSVRQALAKNTYKRFVDDKLDVYNYLDDGNSENKEKNINKARSLLISCESLHYLKNTNKFDVLVIDEIESLLNNWDSTTHKNLEANFHNFKALFQQCKKIILLDAFTTTRTINFLKSLGIEDIITYTSDYKKQTRTLVENDDFDAILNKMVNDINNKRKIFVFYPFLNDSSSHMGIKSLECEIRKRSSIQPEIITYMSKASDKVKKTLYNVKDSWKKADVILTTSSITVGVNYEGEDFDKVYLLTSGMCNLARDLIQVSLRIRCPKSSIIEMFFFDKESKYIYEYNTLYKEKKDQIYNTLIDGLVTEKLADFTASFFKLADLSGFIRKGIKPTKEFKVKTEMDLKTSKKDVVKVIMAYNTIEKITDDECKNIEVNKIWVSDATMEEKFMVSKYYFDRRFKKMTNDERRFIWDNRLDDQFKNLYDPLIQMIEKDNQCGIINIDLKKITISDDTKKFIKETYHEFKHKNENTMMLKLINHKLIGFSGYDSDRNTEVNDNIKTLYDMGLKYKVEENWFIDE